MIGQGEENHTRAPAQPPTRNGTLVGIKACVRVRAPNNNPQSLTRDKLMKRETAYWYKYVQNFFYIPPLAD